jgi:ABC-type lipopolysaccharide export system ATPase subunit
MSSTKAVTEFYVVAETKDGTKTDMGLFYTDHDASEHLKIIDRASGWKNARVETRTRKAGE